MRREYGRAGASKKGGVANRSWFTGKVVSRKSKPRSFQEFENAMKIDLDSFTLCG
jgi:hypothetical protein